MKLAHPEAGIGSRLETLRKSRPRPNSAFSILIDRFVEIGLAKVCFRALITNCGSWTTRDFHFCDWQSR
jgi:hypothetical protein